MKPRKAVLPIAFALLAAISYTQAQSTNRTTERTEDSQTTAEPVAVAAARCSYTPDDAACARASGSGQDGRTVIAQSPRQVPGRPMRPRPAVYPRAYPALGSGEWNTRGAAIGALIGGGLGVAIGIRVNTENHAGAQIAAPLLIGGLGALVGAVAGGNWPAGHSWRSRHRHGWPDDEDEDASRRHKGSSPRSRPEMVRQAASPDAGVPGSTGAADALVRPAL